MNEEMVGEVDPAEKAINKALRAPYQRREAPTGLNFTRFATHMNNGSLIFGKGRDARRLADRAEDIARHLLPDGKRVGNEWCVGRVHGEKCGSLIVQLDGERAGMWKEASIGRCGGLMELWALTRHISEDEAVLEIYRFLFPDDYIPGAYRK